MKSTEMFMAVPFIYFFKLEKNLTGPHERNGLKCFDSV